MSEHDHHATRDELDHGERFWRSRTGIAFTVLAAVAALYVSLR
jgi:anti-sigma-K factor RskA